MNRRDFGKAALGVTAISLVAPAALAQTHRTVKDCIVIDYDKNKTNWHHLSQPDAKGRTFRYDASSKTAKYRHFEFLGSDGLVVGISTTMDRWTHCYDSFEKDFMYSYRKSVAKPFTHSEFLTYVQEVRQSLNGHIVAPEELA